MPAIRNIFISGYNPASGVYNKYDVVYAMSGSTNQYFVSVADNHSGDLDNTSFTSTTNWKRFGDNSWKFSDVWTPCIQSSFSLEPSSKNVKFGDGYEQKSENDIFGSKLTYDIALEPIQMNEARSALAFFEYYAAINPFYSDIAPFIFARKFTCKGWRITYSTPNNFSVQATFAEYMNV